MAGRVCVDGAAPRPFFGWTALFSVLMAAAPADDPAPPVPGESPTA